MPAMEGTQDSSSAGISTPGSRRGTTVTSTSPTRRPSSRASRTASGCPSAGSRPTSDPDLRLPSGNEQWAYPQLRTSRNQDFFADAEKRVGDRLETYRGDWSDWWVDGVGAGAVPLAATRH